MRSRTTLFTLCVLAAACADRGTTVAAPDFSLPVVADRAMADDMGSGHYNPKLIGTNENPVRITPRTGARCFM